VRGNVLIYFFSSRRRHTRWPRDWSSDVCSSDLATFSMTSDALFGIGMGAEWGVGASLVMEKVAPRYRGVVSGLLQQGYALGFLRSEERRVGKECRFEGLPYQ